MQQIPEYSIAELSSKIKQLIEYNFTTIRVRGEVSGFKVASSGHAYFNLKDEKSLLTCTCWRHVISKFRDQIEDGVEVVVTGKVTTYAAQSRYQLSVEHIAPAGAGAWMQLFNQLKTKLQGEGLFDQSAKKQLPLLPKKLALITSGTGAVVHDMVHRIRERCPINIVIYPVAVQGEGAAAQVLEALQTLNKTMSEELDLIIIARGGGSIEDLWCFNDEALARGVYASRIPVISAIGHETDFTILDYVADRRAPTPTAAAEMAVPVLANLQDKLRHLTSFLVNVIKNQLHRNTNQLLQTAPFFVKEFFVQYEQKLDEYELLLNGGWRRIIGAKEQRYYATQLRAGGVLRNIQSKQLLLTEKKHRLHHGINAAYNSTMQQLEHYGQILDSIDHQRVLKRGFALARNDEDVIITTAQHARQAKMLQLQFADDKILVHPEDKG